MEYVVKHELTVPGTAQIFICYAGQYHYIVIQASSQIILVFTQTTS